MAEYIFTNLPQYVKLNSRSEFSSSVVSSGAILLFTEDGYTLTGKLPNGTFITIGGGSSGTDVSDTTATAGTVRSGYDFYDSTGTKTSGTIPTVSATSAGSQITVPVGYIATSQTFNVSGGVDVSDTTATAATVLSGYDFYDSAGVKTNGTIPTLASSSYTPGNADQVISSGQYLGGDQTIKGDANLTASNIASGISIFGISGTHQGGTDVSDTTATAATVRSGYDFYDSTGTKTSGTIPSVTAATITPTTSNQVISSGGYLDGDQTILGDANLVSSNIASGVSIFGVTGTLVVSGGAEVTLGHINYSGAFQPVGFSGTEAFDSGAAVVLPCYTWNIPESPNTVEIYQGDTLISAAASMANEIMSSGYRMDVKGGTATSTVISGGASMSIASGGTAQYTSINSTYQHLASTISGKIDIYDGTAENNIVFGGTITVMSGGTAQYTSLTTANTFRGSMRVSSGGIANFTTVNHGGGLYVYGGTASNVTVSSGSVDVRSGGMIIDAVNYGTISAYFGGIANNITLSGGRLDVDSGTANSVAMYYRESDARSSWMRVWFGTTATNITVNSGCELVVKSGGTALNVTSNTGAVINAETGAVITYTEGN